MAQYDDTNDTSIVLRIDYGTTSFLLTGDMEADAERDLVNSGANLKVDVLQAVSYTHLNAVAFRSEPDEDGWISITSDPVEEKDLNTLVAAAMEKPAVSEEDVYKRQH